jgi:fibronectin-binding autotransporter adhesin
VGEQLLSNAANNYTGTTKITQGTLSIGLAGSFGTGQIILNGGKFKSYISGTLIANQISAAADSTIEGNHTTLSGNLTGTGHVDIVGGTVTLTGNNSGFSGGLSFADGFGVGNDNALGTGALTTDAGSGTISLAPSVTSVTLANNIGIPTGTLLVRLANAGDTLRLNGVISGTGKLWLNSAGGTLAGTLILGGANTLSGGVEATSGTIGIANNAALGTAAFKVAAGTTPVTMLAVGGSYSFNNGVILAGSLIVDTAGNDLGMNGVISNAGSLTKSGSGTLTLGGLAANTYGGGTFLNGGTLSISRNNQLGTAGTGLTFNGGALRVTGVVDTTTARPIVLNGEGGFDIADGSNIFTLNQVISGTGGLRKLGAGALTLKAANSFTGNSFLDAGLLIVNNDQGLGATGSLTINGGRLSSTASRTIGNDVVLTGAGDINTNSFSFTLTGVVSGSGGILTKNGSGHLILTGVNTYDGGTLLDTDTIEIDNDAALGTGLVTMANVTTLRANADVTLANAFSITNATVDTQANIVELDGDVSGSDLHKADSGTLILANANAGLAGTTALNAGTIEVGADTALGTSSLTMADGTSLSTTTGSVLFLDNAVTLQGDATIGDNGILLGLSGNVDGGGKLTKGDGAILLLLGNNSYMGGTVVNTGELGVGQNSSLGTGTLTLGDATLLEGWNLGVVLSNDIDIAGASADFLASDLTLAGHISGGTLNVVDGGGTLALTNAGNTQAQTVIKSGTLAIGADGVLGSGNLTFDYSGSGNVATLQFTTDTTVGHDVVLTTDGTVDTNAFVSEFAGVVSGSGQLTIIGNGTLVLSNTNTMGSVLINDATVSVTNASSLGAGPVTFVNGVVEDNGGNMTLANAMSVDSGNSGVLDLVSEASTVKLTGALSGAGEYVFTNGGTVEIDSANAGMTGTVVADNITLAIGDAGAIGTAALTLQEANFVKHHDRSDLCRTHCAGWRQHRWRRRGRSGVDRCHQRRQRTRHLS